MAKGIRAEYTGRRPDLVEFFKIIDELKMSNKEVADKLGVTAGTISHWRYGEGISYENIKKVASFIQKYNPTQTVVPKGYTIKSIEHPKDKKDGNIITMSPVAEKPQGKEDELFEIFCDLVNVLGNDRVRSILLDNLTADDYRDLYLSGKGIK